jgi:hypothetical protein
LRLRSRVFVFARASSILVGLGQPPVLHKPDCFEGGRTDFSLRPSAALP